MHLDVANIGIAKPILEAIPLTTDKTEQILESCGLSPLLLYRPMGLVPLHAGEEMIVRAQEKSGDSLFCFRSLRLFEGPNTSQLINIPLETHTVALDGVRNLVDGINGVFTGGRFYFQLGPHSFWIARTTGTTVWTDTWPIVQYNLSVILEGMRQLLGSDVAPIAAAIPLPVVPGELPEDLSEIPFETASSRIGLSFSRTLLTRKLIDEKCPTNEAEDGQYSALSEVNFDIVACSIRHAIGTARTERLASRLANSFGMSLRSYQRHLKRLGTSHGELLADARLSIARDLLTQAHYSVTEIAFELGYRHPGDFTRFFKQRVGLSPSKFRSLSFSPKVSKTVPPMLFHSAIT